MKIHSIFQSINGEVNAFHQGSVCNFIRFAGCSVGCDFCDTTYASDEASGRNLSIEDVLAMLKVNGGHNVTITGGEPMEQKDDLVLLTNRLLSEGYNVSIETSGEVPFYKFDGFFPSVHLSFVVDIKPFTKQTVEHYLDMGLNHQDFFKMVVQNSESFHRSASIKQSLQNLGSKAKFAYSPMYGVCDPNILLGYMKFYDQTDAILSVQLHKLLDLREPK